MHLGLIIDCQLNNNDDVIFVRNCFIGQSNTVLCYSNKFDLPVRTRLFKSYCSSLYGSELWSPIDDVTDEFCVAWRKALRRLLNLPCNSHSYLLPLLTNTLPIFVEICRRSARFILKCLNNASSLVQTVVGTVYILVIIIHVLMW